MLKGNQCLSTRKLGAKYNVSPSSVDRTLKEKGLKYENVKVKTELTEEMKDERIQYANERLKRKGKPIEGIFFADEMGIKLSQAHHNKVWMGLQKKSR